jgi:integrase
MRREEADKGQWDWFFTSRAGRRFIEVRKTEYFTPKGKRRRILPVEPCLWEAIHTTRSDLTPFIVPGKTPKTYTPETEPKNIVYRCDQDHRVLVAWLKKMGIKDDKPCHLLRKEFGSYVATSFGLFAAQRLLGHSSPVVTDAFYAGLTNLPELHHAKGLQSPPQVPC